MSNFIFYIDYSYNYMNLFYNYFIFYR